MVFIKKINTETARDCFLEKNHENQTVGAPGLANGRTSLSAIGQRIMVQSAWGVRQISPPLWRGHQGLCPLPQKINFGPQIREFWWKLGAFLYSSPKSGLNVVLVKRRPKCQTQAVCMPVNDHFMLRGSSDGV